MKKDELINILIEDGEFSKKQLKRKKLDEIQLLFDERYDIEFEDDDLSKIELAEKGLVYDEDYVEDPTIERELLEKHGIDAEKLMIDILEKEVEKAEEETEEEIVIDISKLSVVEQRQYRRTGILPQITINRYTRFDDETPKMDN